MKKKIIYIFILLIVLFGLTSFAVSIKKTGEKNHEENSINNIKSNFLSSDFSISISTDKDSYYEGEEVFLIINVKNLNNKLDSVAYLDGGDLNTSILFKDEYGKQLNYHGLMVTQFPYYNVFKPEEEKIFEIEELMSYGNGGYTGRNDNTFGEFYFFQPGNYIMQIKFTSLESKIDLVSNIIDLKIVPRTDEMNKEFEELLNIYRKPDIKDLDKKNKFIGLKNFLRKYPLGRYYGQVFYEYIGLNPYLKENYDQNVINEIPDFIAKDPNSIFAERSVWYLAAAIKKFNGGNTAAREKLEDIISKYPDTRVSRYAKEILDNNDIETKMLDH